MRGGKPYALLVCPEGWCSGRCPRPIRFRHVAQRELLADRKRGMIIWGRGGGGGVSGYLMCIICPAMTLVTGILWALDRVRGRTRLFSRLYLVIELVDWRNIVLNSKT